MTDYHTSVQYKKRGMKERLKVLGLQEELSGARGDGATAIQARPAVQLVLLSQGTLVLAQVAWLAATRVLVAP